MITFVFTVYSLMSTNQITHLNKQPFIPLLYGKAVLNSIIKTATNTWSTRPFTQQYSVSGQSIDSTNLQRYIQCCRYSNTDHVPVTYPFVMAFPLLMKLMTSAQFPISILGLIHYKNAITQHSPINKSAIVTIICRVSNDIKADKGRFIETHIDIFVDGQLMWECTSTFLQKSRRKQTKRHSEDSEDYENKPSPNNLFDSPTMETISALKFNHFDALKYAYISKDSNPIHLHYIPAKLMGFKSTIMHGMLAKARVLAQLETFIDIQHISIDVQFKSAIFLPAQVCLNVAVSPQNNTFSLTNANNRVPHLSGVISPLLNKTN